MKSVILILSLALLIFGTVSVADATTVEFKIDDNSTENIIKYDTEELEIDFTSSIGSPGPTFSLTEGGTHEFDYGTIDSIKVIKELSTYSITAYLSFIEPEAIVVGSDGSVKTIKVAGMCSMDSDKFSIDFKPETVEFDTNRSFTVELSDLIDVSLWPVADGCGPGCYYINEGEGLIKATVTLNSSPTAVPEPSTFILFGTILIGALGVKKIKG